MSEHVESHQKIGTNRTHLSIDVHARTQLLAKQDYPPAACRASPLVRYWREMLVHGAQFILPNRAKAALPHRACRANHSQDLVMSGGMSGNPSSLWNDPEKRAEIQAYLDTGAVELLGMVVEPPPFRLEGYERWITLSRRTPTRSSSSAPHGWTFLRTTDLRREARQ